MSAAPSRKLGHFSPRWFDQHHRILVTRPNRAFGRCER